MMKHAPQTVTSDTSSVKGRFVPLARINEILVDSKYEEMHRLTQIDHNHNISQTMEQLFFQYDHYHNRHQSPFYSCRPLFWQNLPENMAMRH